jgi:hypothetical protein
MRVDPFTKFVNPPTGTTGDSKLPLTIKFAPCDGGTATLTRRQTTTREFGFVLISEIISLHQRY